jgi:hypothetical protein
MQAWMLASELHVCMQCWPMSCHDNQPLSASNTVASFSRVPRRPHSVQQPTMWQTSRQQVAVCGVQPGQADAAAVAAAARPPPHPHSVLQPCSQHTGRQQLLGCRLPLAAAAAVAPGACPCGDAHPLAHTACCNPVAAIRCLALAVCTRRHLLPRSHHRAAVLVHAVPSLTSPG